MSDRGRNPVTQQRQLRAELRTAREAADFTQKGAADALDWSLSKLIRIETGAVRVSITDLRALLQLYGVTNQDKIDELVDMARSGKQRAWWDRYRPRLPQSFVTFLGLEDSTSLLRQFQPLFVPGLLQTEDYARAVVSLYNPHDEDAIERGVEIRMERQDRFYEKGHQRAFFILDESALRRQIGGPQVMRRQLERLKEVNRLPFVSIQVVTFDKDRARKLLVNGNAIVSPDGTITGLRHESTPQQVLMATYEGAVASLLERGLASRQRVLDDALQREAGLVQLHLAARDALEVEAPGHVARDLLDRPVRLAHEPLIRPREIGDAQCDQAQPLVHLCLLGRPMHSQQHGLRECGVGLEFSSERL